MIEWRAFLTSIGVDDANIVAGFAGGLVNVLRLKSPAVFNVIATTISGALIANYLGTAIAKTVSLPPIPTSFVVGFMGVQVLDIILTYGKNRFGANGSNSSSVSTPTNGAPKDANVR